MQGVRSKARDARREGDIRQMMLAMELYNDDHSQYLEQGTIGAVVGLPAEVPPFLIFLSVFERRLLSMFPSPVLVQLSFPDRWIEG
jgi:hypothetical protein